MKITGKVERVVAKEAICQYLLDVNYRSEDAAGEAETVVDAIAGGDARVDPSWFPFVWQVLDVYRLSVASSRRKGSRRA